MTIDQHSGRRLYIMADYGSGGVWDHSGAPLDPARLPLSIRLRADLARWSDRFQQLFQAEADLDSFSADGLALAHAVKAELPAWSVVYYDEATAARGNYAGPRSEYELHIEGPCLNEDGDHAASSRELQRVLGDRVRYRPAVSPEDRQISVSHD